MRLSLGDFSAGGHGYVRVVREGCSPSTKFPAARPVGNNATIR